MEEHVVDDAEDDRGSADTESQGEDGDEGEAEIFAKAAEREAEIAHQIVEVRLPPGIADFFLTDCTHILRSPSHVVGEYFPTKEQRLLANSQRRRAL